MSGSTHNIIWLLCYLLLTITATVCRTESIQCTDTGENKRLAEHFKTDDDGYGFSLVQVRAGPNTGNAGNQPSSQVPPGYTPHYDEHEKGMYNPFLWKDFKPLNCTTDHMMLYTLGKTGTSTLHKTIKAVCGWGTPWQDDVNQTYPKGIKPQLNAEVAKDFLSKIRENAKVWVVTLVRNPFERITSAFFQTLDARHGTQVTVRQAVQFFHEFIPESLKNETDFYSSFNDTTGYDLFSQPFDHKAEHFFFQGEIQNRRQKQLILRLEDIADWPKILLPYLGKLEIINKNEADSKWYDNLYREFKSAFKFTKQEVAQIRKSQTFKFYTEAEIATMLNKIQIQ